MEHFQSVIQNQALTMNDSKKILEYSECDLENQERLTEINFDQRLLTAWRGLAEVNKIEEGNVSSSLGSFLLMIEILSGREF